MYIYIIMTKIIRLTENDVDRLVRKIINESQEDELGWAQDLANDKSSRANNIRDLYNDERLQEDAWGIAQMFPTHALDRLTGENVDGKSVPLGNIQDMLNQSADTPGFEKYTNDEWELFFETIRTEGI